MSGIKLPSIALLQRSLAEDSLARFYAAGWKVLEPKTPYLDNWHTGLLCEYLEALAAGDIKRLIINVPPRSGKSLLASTYFPVWVWIRNPAERFIFASYSATLSTKLSVDRRALLTSPWFRERWPNVRLVDARQADFSNTDRGVMLATSTGASAVGRGGNFLICDDLISPSESDSDPERATAIRWFDESFSTRADDKINARMLVIEQRTNAGDATGHLLEQGGWEHVRLPAIAPTKTTIVFPRSGKVKEREQGDILWPGREGANELAAIRLRLGSYAWESQYQQNPTSREGNLFKAAWLGKYAGVPAKVDGLVMSLDCASKMGSENDYSACVVLAHLSKAHNDARPGYYLLDAWHAKLEFFDLKRRALATFEQWRPRACLVEDTSAGIPLLQELRRDTALPIVPVRPDGDKVSRAYAIQPILESGRLLLPETGGWLADFLPELLGFPGAAHDDYVDALTQALAYFRDRVGTSEEEWSEMFRAEADKDRANQAPTGAARNGPAANITPAERRRFELMAGKCDRCGASLFLKSATNNGPGQRVCADGCQRQPVVLG